MSDLGYSPGLEGVVAGASEISRIDLDRNRLIIRGYDLVALTTCTFEEVAHLLLCGALLLVAAVYAGRALIQQCIDLMEIACGAVWRNPLVFLVAAGVQARIKKLLMPPAQVRRRK